MATTIGFGAPASESTQPVFGAPAPEITPRTEEEEEDVVAERVPLLPQKRRSSTSLLDKKSLQELKEEMMPSQASSWKMAHNEKIVFYNHESLLNRKILFMFGRSAFAQFPVYSTLFNNLAVLVATAAIIYFLVPNAHQLDTSRFEHFGTFLKVFISFMLGVYVQKGFERWWAAISMFVDYTVLVKNLTLLFNQTEPDSASLRLLQNYAVSATYLLNVELEMMSRVPTMQVEAKHQEMLEWLEGHDFFNKQEARQLKKMDHQMGGNANSASLTVWCWIAEVIAREKRKKLAAGDPAFSPPMQVRLFQMCQDCIARIEQLKTLVNVQLPFMYTHLLALLVYINNVMLSASCGLSFGTALREIVLRRRTLDQSAGGTPRYSSMMEELYEAIQVSSVQLLIVIVEPLLYVAFLYISQVLCYPFGNDAHQLPTETMIAKVQLDLMVITKARAMFSKVRPASEFVPSAGDVPARRISKDSVVDSGLDDDDDCV